MYVYIHTMKSNYKKLFFFRGEYNVAVLQLKDKLVFDGIMPYRPICLPPKCDHDCRTRNGKTQEDLDGFRQTMTIKPPGFQMSYKQIIISNEKCQEFAEWQINGQTIRYIKR